MKDRASQFFKQALAAEAALKRFRGEAADAITKGRADTRFQERETRDLRFTQRKGQLDAEARTLSLRARLSKDERQFAETQASYKEVLSAARRQLADITAGNQTKEAEVQSIDYAQSVAEDERIYHRCLREKARGPAERAADVVGKPIIPKSEWQHTPAHV